ncbi:hypothetical protein [Streptomyces olivochromogenes]|uniref:hypothetical protein n=1 Tax=Streptomyces olivochromogenes TaxID=1963 RepID=UPI001F406014|nr:hypothetical protein [Streptomyces olivochromogenes]MCF3136287.1 hypothetical protein [Streptomyces olivochromogenes]
MTARDPYPLVASWDELKELPEGSFVECARCTEHLFVRGDSDPHAWASEHTKKTIGHDRFRIVAMTNFRVAVEDPLAPVVTPAP